MADLVGILFVDAVPARVACRSSFREKDERHAVRWDTISLAFSLFLVVHPKVYVPVITHVYLLPLFSVNLGTLTN